MSFSHNNYTHSEDKVFSLDEGNVGGSGSLENDEIICCKFCAANGFPHEAIIFRKATIVKWVPFDYFRPYQRHVCKHRTNRIESQKGGILHV
jgi:hypothetical protein